MKTRNRILMTLIMATAVLFTSCSAEAYEITSLPLDYEKIERVIIETPRRNARTVTHVEVTTGEKGEAYGFIRDWHMSGTTLKIDLGGDFTIVLPENNDVEDIDIAIASGSILVDGFDTLGYIAGASAEGDISFVGIGRVKEVRADSTNGNLTVEAVKAGRVKANTISGDIEFRGTAEKLDISGLSGNMRVYTSSPAEVDFDSLTGRRNYSSVQGAPMKIKAASLSGSLTVTE